MASEHWLACCAPLSSIWWPRKRLVYPLPRPLLCIQLTWKCLLQTHTEWQDVFILAGVIHICGVIFYGIFASGELEDWAEPPKDVQELQMEQTQLPPPGGDAGAYYGSTGGVTAVAQQQPGWNDGAQQYATWDDQGVAAQGATNPFSSATAYNGAGYTDPNAAWNNGSAGGAEYGAVDNKNSASFYETRAQYVQPSSQFQWTALQPFLIALHLLSLSSFHFFWFACANSFDHHHLLVRHQSGPIIFSVSLGALVSLTIPTLTFISCPRRLAHLAGCLC